MSTTLFTANAGAGTLYKNSGILRYHFGTGSGTGDPNALTNLDASLDGGDAYVAWCLGDSAVVTPDSDGQLFGMTPGYGAYTPPLASIFASLPGSGVITAANMADAGNEAGIRWPPNSPNSGAATSQARTKASGRIPAGTKVFAWFQAAEITEGASTIAGEVPVALVQTEVIQNVERVAGSLAGGVTYISSIRVAVKNASAASTTLGGTLFVALMHSSWDIPGLATQDQQPALTIS